MICPLTRASHILSLLVLVAISLALGCSKPASPVSAIVTAREVTPQPPRVGPITVSFQLHDSTKPVTGAWVALEGDMSHAGMAPVFGDAREVSPGQYQGQLDLNMAGDWVVLMHITLPNGQKLEEQMDVGGVQGK